MKKLLLYLFFGLLISQNVWAQTVWTGSTSTNWNTPTNWNPATVPTATNDVELPTGITNQPSISTAALAKSVWVKSGATLSIAATGGLTINDSKSFTVGTTTRTSSVLNEGTVQNSGQLTIGNSAIVGYFGLWNEGTFNNNTGANINIDNTTNTGFFNNGTSTNTATITIGGTASVGTAGLFNHTTFNNNACAKLIIKSGLMTIRSGGTITNNGYVQVNGLSIIGTITNNGVLKYSSATSASVSAIANATASSVIVKDFTPYFTYGSTYDGVVNGIFKEETGTTSAGTFTAPNTFVPASGLTTAATITLYAKITQSGCTDAVVVPFVYTMPVCTNPTAYNVTGTGSYCATGTGTSLGLSGSENGVTYQLKNGATDVGAAVAGTGAAISFPNQTTAATYTVVATRTTGGCTATMTGSAVVSITPNVGTPSFSAGATSLCVGGTDTYTASASNSSSIVYSILNGTGASISSSTGLVSAVTGNFTVVATASGTCGANTTANRVVTVNALPTVSITGATSIAVGASTNLSPTSGGAWVSNNAAATVTNGGVVTGVSVGSATFTFTQTSTGCFATSPSVTITTACTPTPSPTATLVWNGSVDTDWTKPCNWTPTSVPTATNDVEIPSAPANQPTVGTNIVALAKSVWVQPSATLTIAATGSLTINSSRSFNIGVTRTCAFFNQGTVQNAGQLTLGNTASIGVFGLWNRGTFNNNTGANINIDNSTDAGLYHDAGTFTNAATITIGGIASVGSTGLSNLGSATFMNTGAINIDRSTGIGLFNGSTFTNEATITIGGTASVGSDGLFNNGVFNNNACGKIIVKSGKISNQSSRTITNAGYVQVDGDLSNSGTFTNNGVLIYGTITRGKDIFRNATASSVIVNNNATSTTIFTYGGTYNGTIDGIFTDAAANTSAGNFTAPNTFVPTVTLNASQTFYAKITPSGTCGTLVVPFVYIVPPSITTVGTLTAFSTCFGTASAEQSFTVSGSNLTANIIVRAPTGFEVSTTSGSNFGSSATLTQSGGSVASTTIYVRLAATATGILNGGVTCASTRATTQNVAVSGTVKGYLVIGVPTYPTTCSGTDGKIAFTYFAGTIPNGTYSMSYSLGGSTFTRDVTFGSPSGRIAAGASGPQTVFLTGLGVGSYSGFQITIDGCTITPTGNTPVELICCPSGNTLHVNASVSGGTGDGSTWANAYPSLSNALAVAHACNVVRTIKVAAGTYKPTKKPFNAGIEMTTTNSRDVTFHIPDGVTIEGGYDAATGNRLPSFGGASGGSILSGDLNGDDVVTGSGSTLSITQNTENLYHVVLASAARSGGVGVTVDGFTIKGGNAGGSVSNITTVNSNPIQYTRGGGIYSAYGTNNFTNNIISNSSGNNGGGIYNYGGTGTFSNNTVSYNKTSQNGAAINGEEMSNATFTQNTISNNTGRDGGGVFINLTPNCSFTNNTIAHNYAAQEGGGIKLDGGNGTFENNTIHSNTAPQGGGGIFVLGSNNNCILNNNLLYNNSSSNGGGFYSSSMPCTLTNNTIHSNTATAEGGGVFGGSNVRLILKNNVLYNNTATNWGGGVVLSGNGTLINNTFYNNAADNGGGLCIFRGDNTFSNNVFWANKKTTDATVASADVYAGASSVNTFNNNLLQLAQGSYTSANTNALGTASGNIFANNPLFFNATLPAGSDGIFRTADDGLALSACSPAIDAGLNTLGTPNVIPTNDILGNGIFNTTKDMGAYEQQSAKSSIPTITLGTISGVSTSATSFSIPYTATTGSPDQFSLVSGTPTAMPSFSAVSNATLPSPISVTIPVSAANTYNFNLTVRNSTTGCVSDAVPVALTVASTPTIGSFPATACVGSPLIITGANFTGATAVSIGGTAVGSFVVNSATQITATIATGNTGTISITTPNGVAVSSSSFTAKNVPAVPTISGSTEICEGLGTTLLANSAFSSSQLSPVISYQWSGGLMGSNILVSPLTTRTYRVAAVADGCSSDSSLVFTLTVNPKPAKPSITADNLTICKGSSVVLTGSCSTANASFRWTTPSFNSGNQTTSLPATSNRNITEPGIYKGLCESDKGCLSDEVSVTINQATDCGNQNFVAITPERPAICPGASITMTATGCTGTLSWLGGASTLTGASVSLSPAATTTYLVQCSTGGSGSFTLVVAANTLAVPSNVSTGKERFKAVTTLTSNKKVGVPTFTPGANVIYEAGSSITLLPGFVAEKWSTFRAEIKGCN